MQGLLLLIDVSMVLKCVFYVVLLSSCVFHVMLHVFVVCARCYLLIVSPEGLRLYKRLNTLRLFILPKEDRRISIFSADFHAL